MTIECRKCKKDIGVIEIKNGAVQYKKLNGLLSSRLRFDGNWGFQCMCGNNSLLCKAEKGNKEIESGKPPKNEDLAKITEKLKRIKPPKMVGNDIIIDNFIIKEK